MNVANLQIEGLLMAMASINSALVAKGLLTVDEVDQALHKAEAGITGDDRMVNEMTPSNRDAVCFPVRLLRLANNSRDDDGVPPFSELARMVGQTKVPYGDQL